MDGGAFATIIGQVGVQTIKKWQSKRCDSVCRKHKKTVKACVDYKLDGKMPLVL